jgi:hypothetical protein
MLKTGRAKDDPRRAVILQLGWTFGRVLRL